MVRVLKEIDYLHLVVLIYKLSKLEKNTLKVLYDYTCNYLKDNRISTEYTLKLQLDLRITNPPSTQYKTLENKLSNALTPEEKTLFKVELFNIIQCGYYS